MWYTVCWLLHANILIEQKMSFLQVQRSNISSVFLKKLQVFIFLIRRYCIIVVNILYHK